MKEMEICNMTILKYHYSFVHPAKKPENHNEIRSGKPISTDYSGDLDKKQHKCSKCNYQSKKKFILKRHIERMYREIKNHHCLLCDVRYYERRILKEHIQAIHEGKKFQCTLCNRAEYTSSRNLK